MISTWLPSWPRKRKPVRWNQPISDNLAANTPQGPGSSADQTSKLPNQVCWLQYPNWQNGGTAQEHPTEYNILGPATCWWSVRAGAVSLPLSSQAWSFALLPHDSDKKTALAAWKALGQATETRTPCLCANGALLCAKRGHSWANAWHFFFTVPLVWLPEYWEWAPKSAWLWHTCWSAFRRDLRPAASNTRHMSYEGLWVCPNTL